MRLEQFTSASSINAHNVQANVSNFKRGGYNGGNQGQHSRGSNNSRGRGNRNGYGRGDGGRNGTRPICQLCGRAGHVALKCYQRFDISFHGNTNGTDTGFQHGQSHTSGQAYLASSNTVADPAWYMDSGATNHVTPDAHNLTTKSDYKGKDKLVVGNGSKLPISHIGSSVISSNHVQRPLYLKNILHVPHITKNLLSISQFTHDNNVIIEFSSNCCFVKDKISKTILLEGMLKDGLYHLDLAKVSSNIKSPSSFQVPCLFFNKTKPQSIDVNVAMINVIQIVCLKSILLSQIKSLYNVKTVLIRGT